MTYRLDVILEDGTRRRANYDSDLPDVIEMNRFRFSAADTMLKGALFVSNSAEARQLLRANGFAVRSSTDSGNFCIRLSDASAREIRSLALASGLNESAVIRAAVDYWLKNGHPL